MQVSARDLMGGLAKGLKVIEAFTADQPRLSISDAAEIVGLDRATTRRCLLTLADLGYCAYDGKYFTVTPRVLRLGTGCLAAMPLPRIVQPWLDRLSEEIGQSTSVSILDGDEIVYVARASQQRVMSISLMAGSRLPAYCTSMGRVLLAALPIDDAKRLIGSASLPARTPKTCTDPGELMQILSDVRSKGFASIDEEVELGLRSVAVPLVNARKQVIAALNVGLAATNEALEKVEARYLPALRRMRDELSSILA